MSKSQGENQKREQILFDIVGINNGANDRLAPAKSRPGDLAGLAEVAGQQELQHEQPATAGV